VLRQTQSETTPSTRFDSESAEKIVALAGRLQDAAADHVISVAEMEQIASELNIRAEFVRQAVEAMRIQDVTLEAKKRRSVTVDPAAVGKVTRTISSVWDRFLHTPAPMWWAIGWIIIPVSAILFSDSDNVALTPFIYVGLGLTLTFLGKKRPEQATPAGDSVPVGNDASREALLAQLFALQRQLEAGKVRRAFLSVDVAGSSELKRTNSGLAIEYSFGQYQRWAQEIVRSEGGLLQSAAGDGLMCMFSSDEAAVRAAQHLLSDLPRFNTEQNQLSAPLRIRCGISAGEIAYEPGTPIGQLQSPVIDQAAALQKQGEPDTLSVAAAISAAALALLFSSAPQRNASVPGEETSYLWRP
jgi:class 3 adenylate cyclase